jgi:hypothetical protein
VFTLDDALRRRTPIVEQYNAKDEVALTIGIILFTDFVGLCLILPSGAIFAIFVILPLARQVSHVSAGNRGEKRGDIADRVSEGSLEILLKAREGLR